jgi:2-polyprenyl-3-methyl-5-hydroxy-6-metoxy-1,4-benzoquinol methylase
MEFLHPQPTETELQCLYGRHYYDAWGLGVAEADVQKLKIVSFLRHLSRVSADLPAGGRILDVGCATGYFLEAAQQMGFEPFGVELSDYGAEVCRRKFGTGRIHAGTLETAVFEACPDRRVDAIFMSDLLEHVRNPLVTLRTARSWLSTGGLLMIITPDVGSLSHRVMRRHWLHYKPEHLFYFGNASLQWLLAEASFKATKCWSAPKCLSLRYAEHQLAVYGPAKWLGRWLNKLPEGIMGLNFWIRLGEITALARAV